MKLRELFDKPEKWTQHALARVDSGQEYCLDPNEPAVCWCLVGGLIKCYEDSFEVDQAINRIHNVIKELYPEFDSVHDSIVQFNDDPKRTFEDIRKVIELADV